MAVLVWSERDGTLGNSIRSGRAVSLSVEEYRAEAEALDQHLDDLLDMAWHALTAHHATRQWQGTFQLLRASVGVRTGNSS